MFVKLYVYFGTALSSKYSRVQRTELEDSHTVLRTVCPGGGQCVLAGLMPGTLCSCPTRAAHAARAALPYIIINLYIYCYIHINIHIYCTTLVIGV